MLCPTLCNPVDCSTPGSPVLHCLREFAQIHVRWVGGHKSYLSNHLILWCPLLLLPSIFPSTRVFSNDLVLWIRWPKYWSFNFNISPSNEYSGLISFTISLFLSLSCSPKISGLQRSVYISKWSYYFTSTFPCSSLKNVQVYTGLRYKWNIPDYFLRGEKGSSLYSLFVISSRIMPVNCLMFLHSLGDG